jgi:hypothetical protein
MSCSDGPRHITAVKCPCGDAGCSCWHLNGIGNWYQGAGFSQEDATLIARLLNEHFAAERKRWGRVCQNPECRGRFWRKHPNQKFCCHECATRAFMLAHKRNKAAREQRVAELQRVVLNPTDRTAREVQTARHELARLRIKASNPARKIAP